MRYHLNAALGRACDHRAARRHGRRDGRSGLSVEEAADAEYLVHLRRWFEAERDAIAVRLRERLDAVESAAIDAEAEALLLRAGVDGLVERARAAARDRVAEYEELCARYGRSWQRHHRDRHFAHLGWRCPRLPGSEPEEDRRGPA